jgi:hypothetical protein
MITETERENLKKAIEGFQDEYQDNTDYLRQERRSIILRNEVLHMERLKRNYSGNRYGDEFAELCKRECNYLFTHYSIVFNKMLKDVLDLTLFFRVLDTLRKIEDGEINQEEGSVLIGKLFADIYLDSARREGEQRDALYADEHTDAFEGKAISWKQFKMRSKTS